MCFRVEHRRDRDRMRDFEASIVRRRALRRSRKCRRARNRRDRAAARRLRKRAAPSTSGRRQEWNSSRLRWWVRRGRAGSGARPPGRAEQYLRERERRATARLPTVQHDRERAFATSVAGRARESPAESCLRRNRSSRSTPRDNRAVRRPRAGRHTEGSAGSTGACPPRSQRRRDRAVEHGPWVEVHAGGGVPRDGTVRAQGEHAVRRDCSRCRRDSSLRQ